MSKYEIQQITDDDDPDRCQAVDDKGQCRNKVVCVGNVKSQYCPKHGGNRVINTAEKNAIRNYQLGQWQARIDKGIASPNIKGLRDEIAILRMMLESRLEHCKTKTDLMLHTGPISDMIMKIEKVVSSCHKLEKNMGQVLDKSTLLNFASRVIQIVGATLEGVEGADQLNEEIGNRILVAIGEINDDEEDID
jgi:hypothetical protein